MHRDKIRCMGLARFEPKVLSKTRLRFYDVLALERKKNTLTYSKTKLAHKTIGYWVCILNHRK